MSRVSSERLTQEEIDDMVRAIGYEGPMDFFLKAIGYGVGTISVIRGVLLFLVVFVGAVRFVILVLRGDFSGILANTDFSKFWDFFKDPVLLLLLGFVILLLVAEVIFRRNRERRP